MVATSTSEKVKGKAKTGVSSIKSISKGRTDTFHIDPNLIEIEEGFNARDFSTPDNQAHVLFLAGSIESEGVKEPLKIRMKGSVPVVTNGESRLRAIRYLATRPEKDGGPVIIETVPVRQEDRFSNDADRLYTQVTSNSGKNFTPLETSNLFRKMINLGQSEEEIAKRTSMDVRRVKQILGYQALPSAVHKMISDGTVKISLAMETFVDNGRDEAKTIEVLTGAIENATTAGKKVSKSYVGGKGGERKASAAKTARDALAEIKAIFETLNFSLDNEDGVETVIASMSKEKETRLRELIGY